MKKILILLLILWGMTGCFTTMPEVNDALLKKAENEDMTRINEAKKRIIAINKEIRGLENTIAVLGQKRTAVNKRIDYLNEKAAYIAELEKLYLLAKDGITLDKVKKQKKDNSNRLALEKIYLEYVKVKKQERGAYLTQKNAELSLVMAQLQLEKAYILVPESERQATPDKKDEKAESAKYRNVDCAIMTKYADADVCSIIKHYNDRKGNLKVKKKEHEKALRSFQASEKKLKRSGYATPL